MLLAIDSATRMLSLALHDGERVRAEMTWETANRHTVELTPAIYEICARTGITVQTLTHLAVSQGPGSFSGLRIGIAVAKGLAMALSVPLIAVPTLDIVAAAHPIVKGTLIAVAQAGRSRVCVGRYAWGTLGWSAIAEVEIMAWDALIASVETDSLIAGEIDNTAHEMIVNSSKPIRISPPAFSLRRASFLADLAWARVRSGTPADPAAVIPIYVNQPGVPHK